MLSKNTKNNHLPAINHIYFYSLSCYELFVLILIKIKLNLYKIFCRRKYKEQKSSEFKFKRQPYPTLPMDCLSGKDLLKRCIKLLLIKLGLKQNHSKISASPENYHDFLIQIKNYEKNTGIISEIAEAINTYSQKVSIHAPMFSKENERDGYFQRIQRVDEEIFDGYIRMYFYEDGKHNDKISAKKIDNHHYFISYNSHDEEQRNIVFALTEMCGLMYVHSINRFMTDCVNVEMCRLLNNDKIKTIWDVHGSVPEEHLMYGNENGAKLGNNVESFFFKKSDIIVVVNDAMKRHLIKKHGETNAVFIVMPIFNIDITKQYASQDTTSNPTTDEIRIIYAGGTQKWQNIELMQSIAEKVKGNFLFKFFVPQPQELTDSWSTKPANVIVDSKAPSELSEEYKDCHYGFVLRDSDVVNYVACPTKIIEYLQYGIVPILKSNEIGDFVELGMQYVNYEQFLDKTLPSESERVKMLRNNLLVLQKFQDIYTEGIRHLIKSI